MTRTSFRRHVGTLPAVLALTALPALAQPIVVPIDSGVSSITVEVCILGTSDSDTSPLAGTITIELDDLGVPTQITLHDFFLQATEDLHILVDRGPIIGRFEGTATDLSVAFAAGAPVGPVPISADMFTFTNVPSIIGGTLSFEATNIICFGLVAAGICTTCPCSETINLADQGTQLTNFSGTVTVVNGLVTLSAQLDTTVPFNPADPDAGQLTITGNVFGQVQLDEFLCGDSNCDSSYDGADIDPFFLALVQPDTWQAQYPGCDLLAVNDINGDASLDGADIDAFFTGLGTGECP